MVHWANKTSKSTQLLAGALLAAAAFSGGATRAAEAADAGAAAGFQERLVERLSRAIAKQYPGARISVEPQIHWTHGGLTDNFESVAILGETSRGEAMFTVSGADGRREGEGWAGYAAWLPARIAVKRVYPGDKITEDLFTKKEVNVAVGQPHELRGVILDAEAAIAGLEARQSVLEGQVLLSTSVQRAPDVRRGDAVTVQLISNGLSLSTQGVAEEPAYAGGKVRVMASKTKRELIGKLVGAGMVEVKL